MALEGYFPRGGIEKGSHKVVFDDDGQPILKSESQDNTGLHTEKRTKKGKNKIQTKPTLKISKAKKFSNSSSKTKSVQAKKTDVTDGDVIKDVSNNILPERLSTKKIAKGHLLLAAVKEIRDYELRLNLPNNLNGVVSITNMAECYTNLLKKFAQSSNDDQATFDELCSLSELFAIGQVVPCICVEEASAENVIKMSLNPKDVCRHLSPALLHNDTVLYGVVAGIEDHGYAVDLGVPGVTAFMPDKSKQGLKIGMMRRFKISETTDFDKLKTGDLRTINVSLMTGDDKQKPISGADLAFNSLIPGTLVEGVVQNRKLEGLVILLGQLKACVHVTHLSKRHKEYPVNGNVKMRVLSVNVSSKYIHLTDLPTLVTDLDKIDDGTVAIPIGDPITVDLSRIVDKYAFVSSKDGLVSYMGISLLPDDVLEKNKKKQKDLKLKCFWFGWDYLEQRPVFSTKQPNVSKSIIPTLRAGESVSAKIAAINTAGAKVKLDRGLYAFIQSIHLTEVPLKQPEKKFKVGDDLECRILSIDPKSRRVRLTAKPSLVKSRLPIVSDLNAVKVGSLVQGVIVKITTGALISFYNNTLGFVPASLLAKDPIANPSKAFYVGQSVQCRIISCDPEKNALRLSLILDGDVHKRKIPAESEGTQAKKLKADRELPGTKMAVGQNIAAMRVDDITSKGFKLVSGQGHRALLPRCYLSDHPVFSELIAANVKSGDVLNDLTCFTADRLPNIVTKQFMMKYYALKDRMAKDWKHIKIGDKYPGVVVNHTDTGVFISLGNGIVGLAPKKALPNNCGSNTSDVLPPGRTVLAKITSLDLEKQRIVVSLHELQCCVPDVDQGLLYQSLSHHLNLVYSYMKAAQLEISRYRVGDLVKGEVTEMDNDCIHLRLDDGTKAIASGDLTTGCKAQPGKSLTAVVVYVDLVSSQLHLLLDKKYVDERRKSLSSQTQSSQARIGQHLKSNVLYCCPDYILVMLKSHAHGQIAFVPRYQHPNSIPSHSIAGIPYGQENRIIVKHCDTENKTIIAVFMSEKEKTLSKAQQLQQELGLPAVGELVDAVISSKTRLMLYLKIGKTVGQLRITEVSDSPPAGSSPLTKYHEGQKLKVKVIGLRLIVNRDQSIKESGEKVMLDCSMRDSQLSKLDADNGISGKLDEDVCIGDVHTCFVTKAFTLLSQHELRNPRRMMIHVSTNGADTSGVIGVNDLPGVLKSPEHVTTAYPIGYCLKAKVKAISRDGRVYMRPLATGDTNLSPPPDDRIMYPGTIVSFHLERGLIVNTTLSSKSKVPLSEMVTDTGKPVDIERFTPGLVVNCYLVKKTRHSVTMSLNDKHGVLSPEDIQIGHVLPAVVSRANNTNLLVSTAGQTAKIDLPNGQEQELKPGDACWIRVIGKQKGVILADLATAAELPSKENRSSKLTYSTTQTRKRNGTEKEIVDSPKVKKQQLHDAIIKEQRDENTGVNIVFKKKKVTEEREGVDFSVGLKSLSSNLLEADHSLDEKLAKLEKEGRNVAGMTAVPSSSISASTVAPETERVSPKDSMIVSSKDAMTEVEYLAALRSNPNDGHMWAKLISVTAEHKGVEAARARAEQALEAIHYRLEKEKLMVWSALLRLELIYGSNDTFDNVKRRAMHQMDEEKVYRQLINIYTCENKTEEAEQCYSMMLRKWSEKPQIWIDYGSFYFRLNKLESARTILQKSLKVLPSKKHIDVIVKFGQMETKYGDKERFVSLFENVLSNFPKRTDIWSVYIDQLVKSNDIERARCVLKRAVVQKLNEKKLQPFTKRFIDFEKQHGNEETRKECADLVKSVTVG